MFWILLLIIFVGIFLYKKTFKLIKTDEYDKRYDHAIIIGGSIAGMTTAAYLTKYFKKISIIENDNVLNDYLINSTNEQLLDYRCNLKKFK